MFIERLFTAPARRRRHLRRRGFLLLDALLTLAVAGLLILYGLSLMVASSSASDAAEQTALAYNAARQAIENVRSYHGAKLVNDSYPDDALGALPQLDQLNNGSARVLVEDYRGPVKKVRVTVSWRTGSRALPRSVTLTTLVAPGGVTP